MNKNKNKVQILSRQMMLINIQKYMKALRMFIAKKENVKYKVRRCNNKHMYKENYTLYTRIAIVYIQTTQFYCDKYMLYVYK